MTLWERLTEFFASLFGFGPTQNVDRRGAADTVDVSPDTSPYPAGGDAAEAAANYGDLLQYLTFNLIGTDVRGNPGYPSSAGGSNTTPTTADLAERVSNFLNSLGGNTPTPALPDVVTYPFPFQPNPGAPQSPNLNAPNTDNGGKFTPYTAPPMDATSSDLNTVFGGNVVVDNFPTTGNDIPPSVITVNQNAGGSVPVLANSAVKPTLGTSPSGMGGGRFQVQ